MILYQIKYKIKIKQIIGIANSEDTKILIDTDDQLQDYITFKNDVLLLTYAIEDDVKFYHQIYLE